MKTFLSQFIKNESLRAGYSRMIFKPAAQTDIKRILAVENGDMGCDGVIISRTSIEIFC